MKNSSLIILVICVALLLGCSREQEVSVKRIGGEPTWIAMEYQMTEHAYHTADVSEAVRTLESLVSVFEHNGKEGAEARLMRDAALVNRMRLAGALYAKGEARLALKAIDKVVQDKEVHTLTSDELAHGRIEVLMWLLNEYQIRAPVWSKAAIDDFKQHIDGKQDLWLKNK